MIYGIGMDLIEIPRFKDFIQKHPDISKIFGRDELALLNKINKTESFAANFCAKEAFLKAVGTGIKGVKLREIQILREISGKPFFKLSGSVLKVAEDMRLHLNITITHTKNYASAVVTAETDEDRKLYKPI